MFQAKLKNNRKPFKFKVGDKVRLVGNRSFVYKIIMEGRDRWGNRYAVQKLGTYKRENFAEERLRHL
jgi:hypothetical protein